MSPAADAANPQSNKCALCPKNVKGIQGHDAEPEKEGLRQCQTLAVATLINLDDPMLIRAPGTSIVPLLDYLKELKVKSAGYVLCRDQGRVQSDGVAHPN